MRFYRAIHWAGVPASILVLLLAGCDRSEMATVSATETAIEDDTFVEEEADNTSAYLQKEFTPADESTATAEGTQNIATANNNFAIKMYHQLTKNDTLDNLVFSPYSISSAIALGYVGAKGDTYDEIQQVFDYPEVDEMLPNAAALYNQLNRPNTNYMLSSTNGLWVQQGLEPSPTYLDNVNRYLQVEVNPVDFMYDPESARKTINRAIAKQTHGLIPQIIPIDGFDETTRSVLTNALYFKGAWYHEFYDGSTESMPFETFQMTDNATSAPTVEMMHQYNGFQYVEDSQAQVIDLPYVGQNISMMVILPKVSNQQSLQQLMASLTTEKITSWQANFDYEDIDLYLPKFKMDVRDEEVANKLMTMGMPTAFSSAADFSGYHETVPLVFDKVVHQAVIQVDELGTEAAAATAVMEMAASEEEEQEPIIPIVFKADHPFIYMIYHKPTNAILFMGQMIKPSSD
ncbi:MAG: serpin family protein [Psychrobacter sp.]|uniref:serpin family protein n=1 Tax=Psychrobacter sp. AOP7-B1-24 TaxID=3457645 RepID=UPI003FB6498A